MKPCLYLSLILLSGCGERVASTGQDQEDTVPRTQESNPELLRLRDQSVDAARLLRTDGLSYLQDYPSDSFTGWSRETVALQAYGKEIPILLFIPYLDGRREGTGKGFYPNGTLYSETSYGTTGSEETTWHENGSKASYTSDHSLRKGTSTVWHNNGQKKFEATWKDGVPISEMWWDHNGMETTLKALSE